MRDTTIARNYAETLLALAQRANDPAGWGRMIADVGRAVEQDSSVRRFLQSPRIPARARTEILGRAFQDRFPRPFVRFLQAVIQHRRQMLLPEIARAYRDVLDAVEGRVRADVTLARPEDEAGQARLAAQLARIVGGREVVPTVHVNPAILAGVIVRIGDTVIDASARSQLARLRRHLVATHGGS
jgi:F-type H+-transporting ATPase subunit delta